MDTTPEGSQYANRYKVYDYPHVGIIDPRTRRLMWKKEGWTQQNPLTAEQFAEYATDFCSRHSFDRPPQAPRPPGAARGSSGSSGGLPAKRPMHEMSEEEQLQAAMRASLQEGDNNKNDNAKDDEDDYEYEIDMEDDDEDEDNDEVVIVDASGKKLQDADADSKPKAVEIETKAEAAPAPPASMLEGLVPFDLGEEPAKGARIQFRMPDGKRKIRKFDPSQSVKHVYAFVAVS